jgi:dTDP-4-dehydrorhamnose reductase
LLLALFFCLFHIILRDFLWLPGSRNGGQMQEKKILVLGVTGMLGHTLFTYLSESEKYDVYATARSVDELGKWFLPALLEKVTTQVDAGDIDSIIRVIGLIRPDVIINCIGIIKQLPQAENPITAISVNALWPHRLAALCETVGARLIHISTDCVFNGIKGDYKEEDHSDATDIYGRTKSLGELRYPHSITLRTSIIGHELKGQYGLVEWFLAQSGRVKGFTGALYSGFPTVEMAHIIRDYVIPDEKLNGLYHVSSAGISKYELLKLVADKYKKKIEIEPDSDFTCNRVLDSTLFHSITGYTPPSWPELIEQMHTDFVTAPHYRSRQPKPVTSGQ